MRTDHQGRPAPADHLSGAPAQLPAGDWLDLRPGEVCGGAHLGAWQPAERDIWPDPAQQV